MQFAQARQTLLVSSSIYCIIVICFLAKKVILIIFDLELHIRFQWYCFTLIGVLYSDLALENDAFSSLQKASGKFVQNEFGFNA